jgi:acetyl esterase
LFAEAGLTVLSVPWPARSEVPGEAAVQDAATALEWAADHAAELDADPARLLVAGEGLGAGLAAAVCLHARDQGSPSRAAASPAGCGTPASRSRR